MTDTIKTYPKLGRFIMNEVYNILLDHDIHKIQYSELKEIIKNRIAHTPFIDKDFAMHKLSHGSSKSYLCTYRWENVLYYYLMQHFKAAFTHFEYWENKDGVHDYITLRSDYLLNSEHRYAKKFHIQSDMNYMFDWAQQLNKDAEENYLHLIGAYTHMVDNDTVEQLLQEIKDSPDLTPNEIEVLVRKIKRYHSYLKSQASLADFRLIQDESILYNRKNVKTRGGN